MSIANNSRQRGSALLTALFIMTLVAIAVTAMTGRLRLDIYRTGLGIEHDKMVLASQLSTFWAMDELRNKKLNSLKADGSLSTLPANLQKLYPGLSVNAAIYDLQGQFNINTLINRKNWTQAQTLIKEVLKIGDLQERTVLLRAILIWLAPIQLERGQDKLTQFYKAQKPPYQMSHEAMVSPSELRLVSGVTAKRFNLLSKYINTLPEQTPINLNTAPALLIKTLGNGLSQEQAEKILALRRPQKGISKKKLQAVLRELHVDSQQITLESNYFLVRTEVHSPDYNLLHFSILKRNKKNPKQIQFDIIYDVYNSL